MTGPTTRLAKYRTCSILVFVVALIGGIALGVLGVRSDAADRFWLFVAGGGSILFGTSIWILAALLLKVESNTFRTYGQVLDAFELDKSHRDLLTKIADSTALSDAAKALANRGKDSEALRNAIRAELRMEQWDAALALSDGIAERFGYVEEAESLRAEITEARIDAMRQRLDEAQLLIQKHLQTHEWEKANGEIERLRRALPDEPRIAKLHTLYENARLARKNELRKSWDSAVQRNDVDAAIEVLGELDLFLTREEARALEESARGVFKAKLLQLGMQFQFAVSEKRWRDAIEVGLQISEEFPNSRMSKEVAEAMDGLRARAGMHADVEVTASGKPRPTAT